MSSKHLAKTRKYGPIQEDRQVIFHIIKKTILLCSLALAVAAPARAQLALPSEAMQDSPNPLLDPSANAGKILLYDLEARFAKDVLTRGGAAFADWFAEDAVSLSNGAAPVVGRVALAKSATWRAAN